MFENKVSREDTNIGTIMFKHECSVNCTYDMVLLMYIFLENYKFVEIDI